MLELYSLRDEMIWVPMTDGGSTMEGMIGSGKYKEDDP